MSHANNSETVVQYNSQEEEIRNDMERIFNDAVDQDLVQVSSFNLEKGRVYVDVTNVWTVTHARLESLGYEMGWIDPALGPTDAMRIALKFD